jgi:hypothetical protein
MLAQFGNSGYSRVSAIRRQSHIGHRIALFSFGGELLISSRFVHFATLLRGWRLLTVHPRTRQLTLVRYILIIAYK